MLPSASRRPLCCCQPRKTDNIMSETVSMLPSASKRPLCHCVAVSLVRRTMSCPRQWLCCHQLRDGHCIAVSLVRRTMSCQRQWLCCHQLRDDRCVDVSLVRQTASYPRRSPRCQESDEDATHPEASADTAGGCPSRPVQLAPMCAGLTRITHHHSGSRTRQKANSLSQHSPLKRAARRRPICRPTNECGRRADSYDTARFAAEFLRPALKVFGFGEVRRFCGVERIFVSASSKIESEWRMDFWCTTAWLRKG